MCGITGVFKRAESIKLAETALAVIEHRGRDGKCSYTKGTGENSYAVAHCLHSVVNFIKQPLVDKKKDQVFLANCEIYNWKELNQEYNLGARNDAEALFKLLQKNDSLDISKILERLDGVYAFCYIDKNRLYLARDIIGEKPIWYSHTDGFAFASEKKALEKIGFLGINELNPRKILVYSIEADRLEFIERQFFSAEKELNEEPTSISEKLSRHLEKAVLKRVPEQKFGLLFSGGIDSTIIAHILKKAGHDFTCYTTIVDDNDFKEPEDLAHAKLVAEKLGLKHKIIKIRQGEAESLLKKLVPLIEDTNVVKAEVGLTFYAACEAAGRDGCKVIFTGLGSEELFAGYKRHKDSTDINKECISGLLKLYERDLYRDDVITMYHGLEARLPFLDTALIEYSLKIPGSLKIKQGVEKHILRLAAQELGLPVELTMRPKKAAQYGSNVSRLIARLTKQAGFKLKSEYLRQFYPTHNLKLGALVSSGKDSIYAMYTLMKQNYKIECLITIKSKNPDSYMFHTPAVELVELQGKSMGIPLLVQQTEGEKEDELKDLVLALTNAKEKYKIEGVITGALYSNYQRERIEKICDMLSLKVFSPLWHINQETELREILDSGFEIILTRIAAEGLDKSWLNVPLTQAHINKLAKLNQKFGLNIAGEGGEYESLVLDGPLFAKKIILKKSEILEENKNSATLIIKKAELADKEEKHIGSLPSE